MTMITTTEAARLLGYTRQHVAWLVKRGKLTGERVGAHVYLVDRASVEAYKAAQPHIRRGRPPKDHEA